MIDLLAQDFEIYAQNALDVETTVITDSSLAGIEVRVLK